jgi:hypothetical protein
MGKRLVLGLALVLLAPCAAARAASVLPVAGTWLRISTTQSGKPVGASLSSWLTFTVDRHFFQVSTPRLGARTARGKADRDLALEQLREQYAGVEARCGTYRVAGSTLVRHSYLQTNPNREGERVVQSFRVVADTLVLAGPAEGFEARFVRAANATPAACVPRTFARPPAAYAGAVEGARRSICEYLGPEVPGLQVAVGVGGYLVWSETFGEADLGRHLAVTLETRFRIGSVSKPITADALALLVQGGKLDLDAPIQRYVPNFPTKRWPVTVRELAGHLAGIRGYIDDAAESHSAIHYPTVTSGLAIFAQDSLLFEPGTRFSHST